MASEDTERDRAVRAMLVDRVERTHSAPGMRLQPERFRVGIVTAVVLVVIIATSVFAVRLSADRGEPAHGGLPATSAAPFPALTPPAGKLLGRFTSDDGPKQHHTIHPNGLSVWAGFTCTGGGIHEQYLIHIPHDSDEGGTCTGMGGSGGAGNKGIAGSVVVGISTTSSMRWTLTLVGIPETYVTPKPIPTPTSSDGSAVRYCTAADLSARFAPRAMPDGVTEVRGGDLVLTNTTGSPCALAGYPEVRFLNGGTPLGHHTMNAIDTRDSTKDGLRAVTLRPGGHAYSQIDWYLPGANAKEEGTCVARLVTSVQVDLAYDLSSPGQTGTLDVPLGSTVTACLNGAHGALGKYGQTSSTVFVDYSRG